MLDATRISRPAGELRPPLVEIAGTGLHLAGPVASDFVVAGDVLVAAFSDGSLRGFEVAALGELWAVPLPGGAIPSRFNGAPMVVDGALVLQSAGHWQRRAPATGDLLGAYQAPALSLRRGVALGGDVLACWWQDDGARMGRLDAASGAMHWEHTITGTANGILAVSGEVAALAISNTCLAGFEVASGVERWRRDVSDIGVEVGPFAPPTGLIAGWPVVVSGLFLLPVQAGNWLGIDPDSGEIHWRSDIGVKQPGVAARIDGHVVTLGEAFAAALDSATGEVIWASEFDDPGRGNYGAPLVSGGHVWAVGARDGRILAFDVKARGPGWYGPFGDLTPPDRPPLILRDRLITADDAGRVRVFASAP
ncbi:MAG: PQQ-like beta-propeller repeat protein [Rhodocyclaceae bacterium]|nr:PQQ-like beta-propeller repeat protein [Rhodocyclaceae bacterium]